MSMVEEALGYAEMGLSVIPCATPQIDGDNLSCSCYKGDKCRDPGKHPIGPWKERETVMMKPDSIQRTWVKRQGKPPVYKNIGIACGPLSDLLVLDVDGEAALDFLFDSPLAERLETCPLASSGKGQHFYLPHVPGLRNLVRVRDDLDLRTAGGQVIAPPSLHYSGRRYEWLRPFFRQEPLTEEEMSWIRTNLVRSEADKRPAIKRMTLPRAEEGARDNTAWEFISKTIPTRLGWGLDGLVEFFILWNNQCLTPPLDEAIIQEKVERVYAEAEAARQRETPEERDREREARLQVLSGELGVIIERVEMNYGILGVDYRLIQEGGGETVVTAAQTTQNHSLDARLRFGNAGPPEAMDSERRARLLRLFHLCAIEIPHDRTVGDFLIRYCTRENDSSQYRTITFYDLPRYVQNRISEAAFNTGLKEDKRFQTFDGRHWRLIDDSH